MEFAGDIECGDKVEVLIMNIERMYFDCASGNRSA